MTSTMKLIEARLRRGRQLLTQARDLMRAAEAGAQGISLIRLERGQSEVNDAVTHIDNAWAAIPKLGGAS